MQDLYITNQKNRLHEPYIYRDIGRSHRKYPSYDSGYTRSHGEFRQRSYDRNRRGYPHSEADPEDTIFQECYTKGKTMIEVAVDIKGSEVNQDHQLEHL